jgi:16S rRNA (cytosine967-C5)-methyltransferase
VRRDGGAVAGLEGYGDGAWWVQDAAATLPARLLGDIKGKRVLDLCAAPGGKTMQLAAMGAEVTALDISNPRMRRMRENLLRTRTSVQVVIADALDWTPPSKFDAIVLDAPCSATGTIRRHPDLPHLKSGAVLSSLMPLQDALMGRAWQWLAPGGTLVYATCSLLPDEGEARVAAFLGAHPGARLDPVTPDDGIGPEMIADGALRSLPHHWPEIGGLDGFYAARIVAA